jgi:hypothetical protein
MTPVEWSFVASGLCYVGLEYWLGKTDRVKAGSVVEALLNGAKTVCGVVFKRKL